MDRGALIKVLWGNCILCGAWMRITDYPMNGGKEFTGPALEFNCKSGAVPVEPLAPAKNVFTGSFRQDFSDKVEKRKKGAMSRFKI